MFSGKLAPVTGLLVLSVAGCGGSLGANHARGRVDDPATTKNNHLACLKAHHVPVARVGATRLQIGSLPAGPTIVFEPTPGVAQGDQIRGWAQPAEVIGSALLYPHQAPDSELKTIENCLAKGVSG
jgi:hypothetical protein